MKKRLLALMLIATSLSAQTNVYYVKLEQGATITPSPIATYTQPEVEQPKATNLYIYPNIEYQTIEGVGGAFNEIGGVALMSLPEEERKVVMSNLFGKEGAAFNYCRTAVGSSDFGVDAYSYSEVAEDYKMEHFSIERERNSVIPYIQQALAINPAMQLFASPWSPPGWMKELGTMDKGIENPSLNRLRDEKRVYNAYALYFAKYVEAYAAEGIDVDQIVIQNECDFSTKYPSCVMPPQQMYEVSKQMRSTFKRRGIKSEIWAGTFRTADVSMALVYASQPKYLAAVDGIGVQYTSPLQLNNMNLLIGKKPTMHTESVCFNGANSVEQAYTRLGEIAGYINYGTRNFCYWNMILDQTKMSGWKWAQNSLLNIDTKSGAVHYNPDYAVMSLIGRYMPAGSKRIAAAAHEDMIAIKQGREVRLFVNNKGDKERVFNCMVDDVHATTATVPAHSMAVICFVP